MKKNTGFFMILAAIVFASGFFISTNNNNDVSPAIANDFEHPMQLDTIKPPGFPAITQFNFNYANIAGMNAGTAGVLWLNGIYYFTRWNSTDYYKYNTNVQYGGPGTLIGSGTYTGSIRDLTTDGRYIYGGKSTTQLGILYRLDTATLAIVNTFTLTGQDIRAIAWDPNRKGFWCTGFSGNIICKDTAGNTKQTITSTLTGKYGLAWDSSASWDSAWVWVWNQETSGSQNGLYKYHAASGSLKASYLFTLTGSSIGIAGGTEFFRNSNFGLILLCNYQNFALVGYNFMIICGIENLNSVVRDFKLNQNYPNPFNPLTNISFVLARSADISLDVFDSKGAFVQSIFNGYKNAGDYEFSFDASNLSSGIYFYTITSGDFKETKRMVLIK